MKKSKLFVLKMMFALLFVSFSTVTWSQTNNALHFGNNAYVTTNYTPNTMQAQTYSAWIYLDNSTGEKIICGNTNTIWNGFCFEVLESKLRAWGPGFDFAGNTLIPLNQWVYVALTYNLTTISLYINGALDTSVPAVISATSGGTLSIGRLGSMNYYFGDGRIDEFSVWNVGLTAAQIQNIYNNSLTGTETGLVSYYKFNQGIANGTNTGITALNDEKNAYPGTLNGFALSGTTSNWVAGFSKTSTAISTISANDNISISQNAEKQITVTLNGINYNGGTICVYRVNGQKMISQPIDAAQTLLNTQFNAGIYLVTVKINGQAVTKKIIVK